MTREEVLDQYTDKGWDYPDTYAMADEIVRLRAVEANTSEVIATLQKQIETLEWEWERAFRVAQENEATARKLNAMISALREPTDAVMKAAVLHYSGALSDAITAAVAAAEKEVGA